MPCGLDRRDPNIAPVLVVHDDDDLVCVLVVPNFFVYFNFFCLECVLKHFWNYKRLRSKKSIKYFQVISGALPRTWNPFLSHFLANTMT